jgi:biopolymer transport protein ExbB
VLLALLGGMEWFTKGGWAMYPLALLSVYALYVVLDRALYFSTRLKRLDRDLEGVLRGMTLLPERLEGELAPLLARSMKEGRINTGRAELAIEHELLHAARNVGYLDTVAQASTMLGLLGTVTGMVQVFQTVSELQAAANPSQLAGGIWEALLTTVFGLVIAIPSFIAYHFFRTRLLRWDTHLRTVVDDLQQVLGDEQAKAPAAAVEAAK